MRSLSPFRQGLHRQQIGKAMNIFNVRWHGIQGCTVGEGKYQMHVVRVQTSKDGPWQALNEGELDQLIVDHNKSINKPRFNIADQVKKLGADSLLPTSKKKVSLPKVDQTPLRSIKKKVAEKLYGKKKAKGKKK